jgi:hypothetical protein
LCEISARLTGMAFGNNVTGNFDTCAACSNNKSRQKNVNKDWKDESMIPVESLHD